MAHDHIIYDSDPHFSIDVDTRAISYVSPDKLMLIQGDHNSEIFTFDMPKFADGHDMTKCDIKQVHFINLDGERGVLKSVGVYVIDDMKDDPEDTSKLVFSWTVPHTATRYVGSLSFAIKLACSGEDSTYEYVWSTLPYSSVPVSKTIENTDEFVGDYSDVLQDWYTTIVSAGEEGVTAINNARKQAVASVQDALANVGGIIVSITEPTTEKAVAWLNPETSILRIKDNNGDWKTLDSIKGEPGGLNNVVQEFGSDETLVISQKAITDKIAELEAKDEALQNGRDSDAQSFIDIGNRLGSLEQADSEFDNRISNLENTVTGEHATRLESLESKDAEIEDTISNHQTHIAALSDAMVDRTTRIRALETKDAELEATNTDLQTQITNVKNTADTNATDILAIQTYLSNKKTMIASGSYVGDGLSLIGEANYKRIDTPFKPMLIVIRDGSDIFQDHVFILDPSADTSLDSIPSATVWPRAKRVPKFTVSSDGTLASAYTGTKSINSFWYWIDDGGITWTSNSGKGAIGDFNEEGVTYTWIAIGLEV